MESRTPLDPIDREVRTLALARCLLRIEARTDTITRLTGMPRGRLAALRRRVGVPEEARHRGPARWRVEHFIGSADRRHETSAFAALLLLSNLIGPQRLAGVSPAERLEVGERLVYIHDYLHTYFPELDVEFESLVLLRTMLVRRDLLETAKCQSCGCLIVVEHNDRRHRCCALCAARTGAAAPAPTGSARTRPVGATE